MDKPYSLIAHSSEYPGYDDLFSIGYLCKEVWTNLDVPNHASIVVEMAFALRNDNENDVAWNRLHTDVCSTLCKTMEGLNEKKGIGTLKLRFEVC